MNIQSVFVNVDVICLILMHVDINEKGTSFPGKLLQCVECLDNKCLCTHLNMREYLGILNLRLTCKLWNRLLCDKICKKYRVQFFHFQ